MRNFVIDMRRLPVQAATAGLHWQVSQATSLYNIRVEMSRDPATGHVGMFMENVRIRSVGPCRVEETIRDLEGFSEVSLSKGDLVPQLIEYYRLDVQWRLVFSFIALIA